MPHTALTNQETTPKILQQAGPKEIHHKAQMPNFTEMKKIQNKTKHEPNLLKPISCTGVLFPSMLFALHKTL